MLKIYFLNKFEVPDLHFVWAKEYFFYKEKKKLDKLRI